MIALIEIHLYIYVYNNDNMHVFIKTCQNIKIVGIYINIWWIYYIKIHLRAISYSANDRTYRITLEYTINNLIYNLFISIIQIFTQKFFKIFNFLIYLD